MRDSSYKSDPTQVEPTLYVENFLLSLLCGSTGKGPHFH